MKESASAGQIWNASKAYTSSNTIKRYDAIIANESVDQLGSYLQKHALEFSGISNETKADDKLQKYNIMKITPTRRLGEIENASEMYLITDAQGHDIGTYQMTDKGPVFKLSPKIQEANEKVMSQFPEATREILEHRFEVKSMEDLADKIAKGDKLALYSKEQAQDEIEDEYAERGIAIDNGSDQDPEEEKAISSVPADMRGQVVALCREKGIQIKEVLVVDCPKCVDEEMENGTNHINPNGEPIIMIKAKSGDAGQLSDDLYMFQGNTPIPNVEADKDRMLELMNQHKGEGAVPELTDTMEDDIRNKIQNQVVLAEHMKEQNPDQIEEINENLRLAIKSIVGDYVPSEELSQDLDAMEEDRKKEDMEAQEEAEKAREAEERGEEPEEKDDVSKGFKIGAGVMAGAGLAAAGLSSVANRARAKEEDRDEQDEGDDERSRWNSADPLNHKPF